MRLVAMLLLLLFPSLCGAKSLPTSWDNFTLVGGFKVPSAELNGTNTRYTSGAFDKRPGTTTWIASHSTVSGLIVEYVEPGSPSISFPYLTIGRNGNPFVGVDSIGPAGVQWIDGDNVIASGRKSYRSGGTYNWVSLFNLATGVETLQTVGDVDDSANWAEGSSDNYLFHLHNALGSGFTRIPQEWANLYTGGRTIGMAAGGYDVLGSPLGPAIGAYAVGDVLPQTLVDYPMGNTSSDGNTHYEIRDTNYLFPQYGGDGGTPLPIWSEAPNTGVVSTSPDLIGPTGNVGYFVADEVSHGAGWIDDDTYSGIVFGVLSPTGYIDYNAQGDAGSGSMFSVTDTSYFYSDQGDDNRGDHQSETEYASGEDSTYIQRLYVYDPECLAQVSVGTIDEWECTPTIITPDFSELPFTVATAVVDAKNPTKIAGVTWDSDRDLLWLTLTQMHDDNKYAVLVAYSLTGDTTPDPITPHTTRSTFTMGAGMYILKLGE